MTSFFILGAKAPFLSPKFFYSLQLCHPPPTPTPSTVTQGKDTNKSPPLSLLDTEGHLQGEDRHLLTVPGSTRKLMSSRTWATRTAKDRLAWMW